MLLCPVVLMIRGSSFYDHVWQGLCVTAVLARVELSVLAPSVAVHCRSPVMSAPGGLASSPAPEEGVEHHLSL